MLLIFWTTTACAQKTKESNEFEALWTKDALSFGLDDGFISEMKSEQSDFISVFTGHSPYKGKKITRRYNNEEREFARSYIKQKLLNLDLEPIEKAYQETIPMLNKQQNPAIGTNLYTIIPATVDTDEYIVLGAHFDTVKEAPGASDNASGCALIYGVAKAMIQQESRKKHLMIVFLDKEEIGHAGALAFSKWLKEEDYNIHSVHTVDQIGWDKDGDRNIELEVPTKELKDAYRKHVSTFDIKAYSTRETGSDHKEFRADGFNAVGITEEYRNGDTSPFHHDPRDTYETIDFGYLNFVTYFVFKVIEDIIN